MRWIELRSMWGKNLMDLPDGSDRRGAEDPARIQSPGHRHRQSTVQNGLARCSAFAVRIKGRSAWRRRSHIQAAGRDPREIDRACQRHSKPTRSGASISGASTTSRPIAPRSTRKLRSAAETAGKQGILLVLENEFECNTATGREAARTLNAIQTPHLALNWDPGNAVMRGELDAFPAAWDTLPKNRIHHCHCKNADKNRRRQNRVGSGRQGTTSTGRLNSAHSSRPVSLTRSASKHTGMAPPRLKSPRGSAGRG